MFKDFKHILKNQQGMSLIEVIVASVISIIIAMGVVKINETSMQGFKTIELKSELSGFENRVRGTLLSADKCTAGEGTPLETITTQNYSSLFTATDYLPPQDQTVTGYQTTSDLHISTGPGSDRDYSNTSDNPKLSLFEGEKVPGAPNWKFANSNGIRIYADIPNETCYLMLRVVKSIAAGKSSFGGEEKLLWFTLKCEFSGNDMISCSGQDTVAEGIFQEQPDGEWAASPPLHIQDQLQVGGAFNDDDNDGVLDGTEVLRVVGDTLSPTLSGYTAGMALPQNHVILMGDDDTTNHAPFDVDPSNDMLPTEIGHKGGFGFHVISDSIELDARNRTGTNNGISMRAYGGSGSMISLTTYDGEGNIVLDSDNVIWAEADAGIWFRATGFSSDIDGDATFGSEGDTSIYSRSGSVSLTANSGAVNLNLDSNTNDIVMTGNRVRADTGIGIYGASGSTGGRALYIDNHGMWVNGDSVLNDNLTWNSNGSGDFRINGSGRDMLLTNTDIYLNSGGNIQVNNWGNVDVAGTGHVRSGNFVFHTAARLTSPDVTTISSGAATSLYSGRTIVTPAFYGGNYYYWSDERFKKEIKTIERASEKLEDLRGVTYFLRADEFPEKRFEKDLQYGLIAQEVEAIFPELVETSESGYKSVKYANLVAVLIEGFKEQMQEIKKNRKMYMTMIDGLKKKDKEQDRRLAHLEKENKELKAQVNDLKSQVKAVNEKLNKILMKL